MEPNFVVIPNADPLDYLWACFPELRTELNDDDFGTYYVYGQFSDYLASHRDDEQLWQRSCRFFELLAAGDSTLQNILSVGMLEQLCDDPMLTERLKSNLGPLALKLLAETRSF